MSKKHTTKTSAYQAAELQPISWEMNISLAEKMLSIYKIYQPYHVFSFLYLLYDYLFLFIVMRHRSFHLRIQA